MLDRARGEGLLQAPELHSTPMKSLAEDATPPGGRTAHLTDAGGPSHAVSHDRPESQ
jgi:hypothetical protein